MPTLKANHRQILAAKPVVFAVRALGLRAAASRLSLSKRSEVKTELNVAGSSPAPGADAGT